MQTENENKITLSIIVPVYNVEKYLDQCVQALLAQTLSDIEIILIDDESPDNCCRCATTTRRSKRFIQDVNNDVILF